MICHIKIKLNKAAQQATQTQKVKKKPESIELLDSPDEDSDGSESDGTEDTPTFPGDDGLHFSGDNVAKSLQLVAWPGDVGGDVNAEPVPVAVIRNLQQKADKIPAPVKKVKKTFSVGNNTSEASKNVQVKQEVSHTSVKQETPEVIEPLASCLCSACNKMFTTEQEFLEHLPWCNTVMDKNEKTQHTKSLRKRSPYLESYRAGTVECNICYKRFSSTRVMRIHMNTYHRAHPTKKGYKKKLIAPQIKIEETTAEEQRERKEFLRKEHLKLAELIKKSKVKYNPKPKAAPKVHTPKHLCKKCFTSFRGENQLNFHICEMDRFEKVEDEKYKCKNCNNVFDSCNAYALHPCRMKALPIMWFQCPICPKKMRKYHIFKQHMRAVHSAKTGHNCETCNAHFKTVVGMYQHQINEHNAPARFKCNLCERGYYTKKHYESHVRMHTGERPHQCELCGKSYPDKGALSKHIETHNEERIYGCKECEKKYRRKKDLYNHWNFTHNRASDVQCMTCGKIFKSKEHLRVHNEIHLNLRKYKCDMCGVAYNNAGSLYTHKKKHKGALC